MLPLLVAFWKRSQNIPNNRFLGRRNDLSEPEPAKSEGVANVAYGFRRLSLLNESSELVSEDDFRSAVRLLNTLRLRRAESLGDGYDVSDNLCSDIDPTSNIPNAVP